MKNSIVIDGNDDAPITKVTFLFWANNERKRVDALRARIVWGLVGILVASAVAIGIEGYSMETLALRQDGYERNVEKQFYANSTALADTQFNVCHYAQTIADTVSRNEAALAKIETNADAVMTDAERVLSIKKATLWGQFAKQINAVKRPKCDGLPAIDPIKE